MKRNDAPDEHEETRCSKQAPNREALTRGDAEKEPVELHGDDHELKADCARPRHAQPAACTLGGLPLHRSTLPLGLVLGLVLG